MQYLFDNQQIINRTHQYIEKQYVQTISQIKDISIEIAQIQFELDTVGAVRGAVGSTKEEEELHRDKNIVEHEIDYYEQLLRLEDSSSFKNSKRNTVLLEICKLKN